MKAQLLPPQFARLKRKAARRLQVERVWHYLRWLVLLIGLWGCAACLHLPQSLPDYLHFVLEFILFGGMILWVGYALHHEPPPSMEAIDQRIARDAGLAFHPLAALTDRPALLDTLSDEQKHHTGYIWALHRQRLLTALETISLRPPRFFHHWGERLTALLLLISLASLAALAGPQLGLRLKAGFLPGHDDDAAPLPSLQAWINQPHYAPGAPVFLTPHMPPLSLPEGAMLHILVGDAASRPSLRGKVHAHYSHLPSGEWQVEATLHNSHTLILTYRGRILSRWSVQISRDTPPDIRWDGKAGTQDKDDWHTNIPWAVSQPHGVIALNVQLHPIIPPSHAPDKAHEILIPLPLKPHTLKANTTTRLDLSKNPFAGLHVVGRLCAQSSSGKWACSATQTFKLGHRPFHNPISRALLALRLRLASGQDDLTQTAHTLQLLTDLALPNDVAFPLIALQNQIRIGLSTADVIEQLWFDALYNEDRQHDGQMIALSMLHVRALQNAVQLHLRALAQQPIPPSLHEQNALHDELDRLKDALDQHLAFIFQKANRNGLIMPMPDGNGMPWTRLAGQVQADALAGHIPQALDHLQAMLEPAEQMRQATLPDMQTLAASMQAQAEARSQRMALRDLIREETNLLNHAQKRLAAEQSSPMTTEQHKDVSQMSTAELLNQLGMAPRDAAPPPTTPLEHTALLNHADDRRQDHATQYALRHLVHILNKRGEVLTKKKMPNLVKAEADMGPVLHNLANRQDDISIKAIQTVLDDLSKARHEMKHNQTEMQKQAKGHLGFIPPPSSNPTEDPNGSVGTSPTDDPNGGQDQDNDEPEEEKQPQNRDPLGRKLDDSPDSDAHIPDHENNRAHDIERELQRRASDRTRPQSELDYLNRLLAPLRQPH
ncbi:DUF4175 family protein [Bombella saccharophila]|uniref:DUF4175 domain-containing protein n=1 Tax=Bombella saccharophila TaxID=2967338 RepID=A0ABT3W4K7_9PROT|nr:DUF4175 family protein [Bombella saccharophila]MCX5613986.1 DUF4175 domain-containing protein [Bombella saccharophila]